MKKLIVKLNISNIQFTKENAHSILVKVDYGVYLRILFNETSEKVEINEAPKGYNLLSGPIPLTFRGQLVFSSILLLVVGFYTCYQMYVRPALIPIMAVLIVVGSVLFIFWALYFGIRLELMKKQLMGWINEY
ncbi:MAG: hypothetical protein KA300_00410 [Bacteroidales bacterium]|nr:hypothetical protein [Bacteroidales bacterium]MBP8677777.1 hypothetical protein [Bacteroidales bacterium]MBP9583829.1 hypothetical protein [Bacteroidales bacterium]MBP9583834.1 hypothetical protein [Bacteroidales bacterium]MBP9978204.1 hypothetical protein [Bacteroidales bacterium]